MANYDGMLDYAVIKEEAVAGTAETLAQADFDIQIIKDTIEYTPDVPMDDEASGRSTGHDNQNESVPGQRSATVTFNCRHHWSNAVATPPNISKLFKGCGLLETVIGATGVKWEPQRQAKIQTVTIGLYHQELGSATDTRKILLAGCMGNCITGVDGNGMPVIHQFTFTGKIVSETDEITGIVEGTLDNQTPEKYQNVPTTLYGYASCVSNWKLDFGNEVVPKLCGGEGTGIEFYHIGDRTPTITANPLMENITDLDIYNSMIAGTNGNFTVPFGTNHFIVNAPITQIIADSRSVRESKKANDITLKCRTNDSFESNYDSTVDSNATFQFLQGATA